MGNNHVKLAISVCSNRPMEPRCAISLSMLVHHLTAFNVPFGIISRMQASLLPQARQECLDEALRDGCTHQLWWDDDIEMTGDCVLRMLQAMHHRPEVDAIAANYCRKQDELRYTAETLDGVMMESSGRIGLEEAKRIGLGLVLLKLDKVANIPAPHFEIVWNREYGHYMGEDRYFVEKLRSAGMRIFVDHGLSNWVQHWGCMGYNFRLWNRNGEGSVPPTGSAIHVPTSEEIAKAEEEIALMMRDESLDSADNMRSNVEGIIG